MIKKIILAFFPGLPLFFLVVAAIATAIGGKYTPAAYVFFNLFLLRLSANITIILHEMGHLACAKLVGGTPRRMVLGKGHKILRGSFKGIKIVLNSKVNSGLAYAAFDDTNLIKWKLMFYTSGGILVNFLTAGILFLLFGFSLQYSEEVLFSSILIFSSVVIGAFALIPKSSNYLGRKIYSDGYTLLRIPFYKKSDFDHFGSVNELLDAYDFLEEKQYEKAIIAYEKFQSTSDIPKAINLNLSIAYLKLGNFEKSLELIEDILNDQEEVEQHRYKSVIYNAAAWSCLVLNYIEKADSYSEISYDTDVNFESGKGTRGCVLVEIGQFQKGVDLLEDLVDFEFPNNETLTAAMYLSWAFRELGKAKKQKKYWDFVAKNTDQLDVDEKVLYDRIKEKLNPNP